MNSVSMINGNNKNQNYVVSQNKISEIHNASDHVIDNTYANRLKIGADKLTNAFTVYPAKGLKGDKNANFYEFLTMGQVPYLIGSGLMMSHAIIAKKYDKFGGVQAAKITGPAAIGVVLYGVLKNLSRQLINKPIEMATGVDLDLPYRKVVHELPSTSDGKSSASIEYHKVFESADFPRWDLLYDYDKYGSKRGSYYDHVAKKMGLGENLESSDQAAKPKIKELLIKARTTSLFTSYLWAGLGVILACQDPIANLFEKDQYKTLKQKFSMGNIKAQSKKIANAVFKSCKDVVSTKTGKAYVIGTIAATVLSNIICLSTIKQKPVSKEAEIDKSKDYTVG